MKIFMGENFSCGVNYQYFEIMNELKRIKECELVLQPEDADVIIFASTCSCHEDRIYQMIGYIDFILEKVEVLEFKKLLYERPLIICQRIREYLR